jgi:hypothetical protein
MSRPGHGAAGTSDRHRTHLLRIQIQEQASAQRDGLRVESDRAGQAGLLVDREQQLQRTMREIVVHHHGQ